MPRSVQYVYRSQNLLKLNMQCQRTIPKENTKNMPPSLTFSKIPRTWSFTLLFYRGRLRNVPRIITHVHSYCSAHKPFVLWRSRCRCRRGLLKLPNNKRRNQDATPRSTSIKKMILYFTYESRDTLKSFSFVSQCPNYSETESETRRNI